MHEVRRPSENMTTRTRAAGRLTDQEPEAVRFEQETWNALTERRRSYRASLHWTVYLACDGLTHPVCTRTRDISRDGFYCLLNHQVRLGDRIECDLVVPTHNPRCPGDVAYLRCRALIVRVERTGNGAGFGLGCRIEDYYVIRSREESQVLEVAPVV
jgi:hypothetical protein